MVSPRLAVNPRPGLCSHLSGRRPELAAGAPAGCPPAGMSGWPGSGAGRGSGSGSAGDGAFCSSRRSPGGRGSGSGAPPPAGAMPAPSKAKKTFQEPLATSGDGRVWAPTFGPDTLQGVLDDRGGGLEAAMMMLDGIQEAESCVPPAPSMDESSFPSLL